MSKILQGTEGTTHAIYATEEVFSYSCWLVGPASLVPRPSNAMGEGEGRPGIHCMRMRRAFCIFYRKSVRKSTVHTRRRFTVEVPGPE